MTAKPTFKPRPNTDAQKHKKTKLYDKDKAMKKIESSVNTRQAWQKEIDGQQRGIADANVDPVPRRA